MQESDGAKELDKEEPRGEGQGGAENAPASSPFALFAEICEQIRSTPSKLEKVRLLSEYLAALKREEDLAFASVLLSGRIFPPGTEPGEIHVGYSLLWHTISQVYKLKNVELSAFYLKHGDLGSTAEEVARAQRPREYSASLFQETLTLQQLEQAFHALARVRGKDSVQKKQRILEGLLAATHTPLEAKFLVRVIAGEMRIGLVEGLLEEALAKASGNSLQEIRAANLVAGNIGWVAVLARAQRLAEARLSLGTPTNFMLAEAAETAELLYQKFPTMPVLAEYKYDGIRAQAHMMEGRVRLFSRNLEEVTPFFPEIEAALKNLDRQLILDGEIIASRDGTPLSFQLLQRRLRKLQRSEEDVPVKYFAFDLLYFSKPLIQLPLSARMDLLHALQLKGGALAFSRQQSVSSAEEILQLFLESKRLGFEGLVVKDPRSAYTPGRRGASWVKLKQELDTLDVVIVAAEYGHGKRAGVISDYTFAVQDHGELKVIGKAYSGLTDKEILEMTKRLRELTLADQGYRRTVRPEIVLEVAFDAIQRSERHDSGYALRFPRIKRIREDKGAEQIDTLERVRQIYEKQQVKI